MDPYLERHWLDVHTKLVTYAADSLNRLLPDSLVARIEERIAVEADRSDRVDGKTSRLLAPDVRVFEGISIGGDEMAGAVGLALAPYRLEMLEEEAATERFVEIIDIRGGERLVTVIEFVSPANKSKDGLKAFRRKRRELLSGNVNFVEIDLVRAGRWRSLMSPLQCPAGTESTYRAVIRTPGPEGEAYLHPIPLRDRLPTLNIPLRPEDAFAQLELQRLVDDAYLNRRYERTLRYDSPCDPPLRDADALWADDLLRAAGRR